MSYITILEYNLLMTWCLRFEVLCIGEGPRLRPLWDLRHPTRSECWRGATNPITASKGFLRKIVGFFICRLFFSFFWFFCFFKLYRFLLFHFAFIQCLFLLSWFLCLPTSLSCSCCFVSPLSFYCLYSNSIMLFHQ